MATLCDGCGKIVTLCTCADRDPTSGGGSQTSLDTFEPDGLDDLSPKQREAYRAIECRGTGVREYADQEDLSPGTVGNHLRRARRKVGGSDA